VIVNADSQQVYRDIPIGTAQPTKEEREILEHRLYGFVPSGERLSAGAYVELADKVIAEVWEKGKIPVFVGGSGLYIQSLLYGLDPTPVADQGFRESLKRRISNEGLKPFYLTIQKEDPEYASVINPNDPVRIIRWHEIFTLSGLKLGELRKRKKDPRYRFEVLYHTQPREELHEAINARCRKMLQSGWIEETMSVRNAGYEEWLRSLPAIGYSLILDYLDGKTTFICLLERISALTRQYAKRQETWFKKMGFFT
jgi:tRNA dimethylallyltransferase